MSRCIAGRRGVNSLKESTNEAIGAVHHILVIRLNVGGLIRPLEGPSERAELGPIARLGQGVQGFGGDPGGAIEVVDPKPAVRISGSA